MGSPWDGSGLNLSRLTPSRLAVLLAVMLADLNSSGAQTVTLTPDERSGLNWVPSEPLTGSRCGGRQLIMVV